MLEYTILKYLMINKDNYIKYYNSINIDYIKSQYRDLYKIFKTIESYYEKQKDVEYIPLQDLEAHYLSIYPAFKEGDRALLSSILQCIDKAEITSSVIDSLEHQRLRSVAGEIALTAFDVAEGKKSLDDLHSIYAKLSTVAVEQTYQYVTNDLEELYNQQCHSVGLRWRLHFLNQSLGSLRKGDFGFIFARPETGKTTFLASEGSYMAQQTDSPVLWCNNEEGGQKVQLRCIQAALGLTTKELFSDIQGNKQKYFDLVGDKLKIYDDPGMSIQSIEARCEELKPSLIILDQIDKIIGYKDDRYDLQMKFLYQWARELSKKYGPVIGVCQAGGEAEGKRWLTMNDVDSSKTAKQGEADWILGIGKSNDEGMRDIRFLNLSKNKLLGDDDSLSELRHGKAEVQIKAEIARYEGI